MYLVVYPYIRAMGFLSECSCVKRALEKNTPRVLKPVFVSRDGFCETLGLFCVVVGDKPLLGYQGVRALEGYYPLVVSLSQGLHGKIKRFYFVHPSRVRLPGLYT